MAKKEPTIQNVLDVIQEMRSDFEVKFEQIDARFEQIDARFEQIDARFEKIYARFEKIYARFADMEHEHDNFYSLVGNFVKKTEERFDRLEEEIRKIRQEMKFFVTRDYLDKRITELRGDMTVLIRKEDRKVDSLIRILQENEGVTVMQAEKILAMEPFPVGA